MPSLKHLNGIAHSLGHHAQSSFSRLHPHLVQACRAAGLSEVSVDLLAESPYPEGLRDSEPLRRALARLRERFLALLAQHGLSASDVASVRLTFGFRPKDDGDCSVRSTIRSRTGREFTHFLGFIVPYYRA